MPPLGGPAEGASARWSRGPGRPREGTRASLQVKSAGSQPETRPLREPKEGGGAWRWRWRREAAIPPRGGLGEAREGEERPSTRWQRGRERNTGSRLATLAHGARALLRGREGSVLPRRAGRAGQSPDAAAGLPAARGVPALGNKGAAQPLLPPTSVPARPGARRPGEPAGRGCPPPTFGKLTPQPATHGGAAGRGQPGVRVFRTATSPVSFPGKWRELPWPRSPPSPRVPARFCAPSAAGPAVPRSTPLPADSGSARAPRRESKAVV